MIRIRRTPLAVHDLQEISAYIESRRNLPSANRVCREIYDAVQVLRRFPERGKVGLEANTRELVTPKFPAYIIAYRIGANDSVEILPIWHGAQGRGE